MPLGIGLKFQPSVMNGAFLADAGEHVLEGAPVGRVIEHAAGGDEGRSYAGCQLGERGDAGAIVAAIRVPRREIEARRERLLDAQKVRFEISIVMPANAGIQ